jgi:hypothetical protein
MHPAGAQVRLSAVDAALSVDEIYAGAFDVPGDEAE